VLANEGDELERVTKAVLEAAAVLVGALVWERGEEVVAEVALRDRSVSKSRQRKKEKRTDVGAVNLEKLSSGLVDATNGVDPSLLQIGKVLLGHLSRVRERFGVVRDGGRSHAVNVRRSVRKRETNERRNAHVVSPASSLAVGSDMGLERRLDSAGVEPGSKSRGLNSGKVSFIFALRREKAGRNKRRTDLPTSVSTVR
jgi:hypothetical protein